MMYQDNNRVIRKIEHGDLASIIRLFKETVHSINVKDYNRAQLQAWAPQEIDCQQDKWQKILHNIAYLVEIEQRIVGFADTTVNGYLDRLFVDKDHQRQGIATQLTEQLEIISKAKGIKKVTTEASITAKAFFESKGYRTVKQQHNTHSSSVILTNFLMEKNLY